MLAIIEDAGHTQYDAVQVLGLATKALKKSARLDPNAQYIEETNGNKFLYNHDILAAQILFLQSGAHLKRANELIQEFTADHDRKEFSRTVRSDLRNALAAAQKATQYQPNDLRYLNRLALAQRENNQRWKARQTVRAILKLDPGNVDALTLRNNL